MTPRTVIITMLIALSSLFGSFDPETDVEFRTYFERTGYRAGESFRMILSFELPDGYHVTEGDLFYFDTDDFPEITGEKTYLTGMAAYKNETVYKGQISYLFEGKYPNSETRSIIAGYQICYELGDDFCFMPVDKEVVIDFGLTDPEKFRIADRLLTDPQNTGTPGPAYELTMEERLASMLQGKGSWSVFAFLITFLGGIFASLTPCVYPIIPVVISYMGAKSGKNKSAGFMLSLFFVLGLAVTYSVIGLLASFFSDLFGVGDFASNPVVRTVIAIVFLFLALSMFGFWDMKLISSEKQTKLMQKGKEKKGAFGALMIGMVSGIVAAPCVGPVLAMLLIHVANAGDVLYGSLIFMTFAFGMGVLFLVIGTFSGALSSLPNSGAWMVKVKKVFGIIMIGASLYFIRIVIPESVYYFITAVLLFMLSGFLGGLSKFKSKSAGMKEYLGKSLGLFLIVAAVIISVKSIGMYIELPFNSAAVPSNLLREQNVAFEKTDSDMEVIDRAVRGIKGTEKLVMVDLWAEWCTNCIELDKRTWNDAAVVKFVEDNFVPVKLDFTKKDSDFSKKFISDYREHGATNLPLILFINERGEVVEKILGFINAERMLARLKIISENNR